jgi:phosphate transport system substrate-binding protein
MRNLKALLMGSAAVACVGVATQPAQAGFVQEYGSSFGAGSTAAQITYRQIFDCLYDQAQGTTGGASANGGPLALSAACTSGADTSGFGTEILYAGTGSGNGKTSFIGNNPNLITAPSNSIPWSDQTNVLFSPAGITATTQYDGFQFGASDDPWNSTDAGNYTTAGGPAAYGGVVQVPSMIIPIAMGYNGTDGTGAALTVFGGGTLNLTRQAACGIAAGYVTQWSQGVMTSSNGGHALGNGNITFIHRSDTSGSTFLVTNALITQCQQITGPNYNAAGNPTVSYAFPWTDHTAACPVSPVAVPTDQANWPDLTTDQCGNAIANPGGGHYNEASGSGAIVTLVGSTNGSIGYASVDYWAPVKTGGLPIANVQNQWSVSHGGAATFATPNAASAASAMSELNPQFPGTSITDPIAWSLQGVNANPALQASYPISGFTWLLMYQCYKNHSNGNNAFIWIRTALDGLYGSSEIQNIVTNNGFANVPSQWVVQIYTLLNSNGGPAQVGNLGCTSANGFSGAGAY